MQFLLTFFYNVKSILICQSNGQRSRQEFWAELEENGPSTMRHSDFGTTTHGEDLHKNEQCALPASGACVSLLYTIRPALFALLKLSLQSSFFDANSGHHGLIHQDIT